MKATKNKKLNGWIDSSVFVSALKKVSDFFFNKIITCKAAQFLCSYDKITQNSEKSLLKRFIDKIKPNAKTILKAKNKFAIKLENSFAYNVYLHFLNCILGAKSNSYGAFFSLYGFLSVCVGFAQKYSFGQKNGVELIWQGALLLVLSIPLIFSKSTIGELLVKGKLSSKVIDFFEFKKENIVNYTSNTGIPFSIFLALVFGLSCFYVSPILLILLIASVFVLVMIFHKPEVGVLLTVALLPFTPTLVICAEIIIELFAFLLKVARGKRTFKLDILDFTVLLFAVFFFLGGLFSVTPSSSLPPSCVYVCFISFYFVIVNLIKTTKFSKKIISCSIFSSAICALYGIYQNFFAAPDTTWTDEDMFSDIETRVVSTFENPNVFGEYLIMLIPLCIATFILTKGILSKTCSLVGVGASLLALVYTWSRGAWLGFIASMIIFLVIVTKRAISLYLLGAMALPIAIPWLPTSIIERFTSIGNMTDSSTSYRVFIWEASVKMIKDYFATGIGVGTSAFQTVYSEYALAGIETAPHSHNLYLQIFVELGVFGLLTFVAVILLFFTKVFTFMKNGSDHGDKILLGAFLCGILAFLLQGITDYVWYNYRVFALFWMLIALCSAFVNSSKSESLEKNELE